MKKPTAISPQPTVISHRPDLALARLSAVGCWLAVLGAAACNEIGVPLRPAIYAHSLIVSDVVQFDTTVDGVAYFAGDTITDTVHFSWPASRLPVKIWVQDTVGLPHDVDAAIAAWKNVLVYGEIGATIVSDSTKADIIVRGSTPLPLPAPRAGARLSAIPPLAACEGVTDVFISAPDHTKLWLPIRVYVNPKYPLDVAGTRECLARVTIHELGHALGLFQHSPNPDDIMYAFPDSSVHAPSDADAATILYLYHRTPGLRPVLGADTLPPAPAPSP